jgi:hypothetical protein
MQSLENTKNFNLDQYYSTSQLLFLEDFTALTAGPLAGQGGWIHVGAGLDAPADANTIPLTYTGYNYGGGNYLNFAIAFSNIKERN